MNKAFVMAAALVLTPLPAYCQNAQNTQNTQNAQAARGGESSSLAAGEEEIGTNAAEISDRGPIDDLLERLSQSQLRDRLDSAIARVENACSNDIEEYCGTVTPGGGRIALCMRAHADLLSRRCRFTLFRVGRNIRQDVANLADDCMNGIKSQCSNTSNIGECAEQKSASISPACHTVVAALRHAGQRMSESLAEAGQRSSEGGQRTAALQGTSVFTSDGQNLGRVVEVQRNPDGKIQSVQIQIGRFLGIGDKVVTIGADQLQQLGDRIKLRMDANQVRSLPEAKKQGS